MAEADSRDPMREALATFGSDLSRWPGDRARGVREALLRDVEFRRAWERARSFDRDLGEARDALDGAIRASGAPGRVSRAVLARLSSPRAVLRWRQVAAAVVVAGMLGGALDLVVLEQQDAGTDVVMLDPLSGLVESELQ